MGYQIKINVEQSGLILTAPDRYQTEVLDKLNGMIIRAGMYLLAELQKNTPVGATGSLRRGWKMDTSYVSVDGGRLVVVNIYNPLGYNEPTNMGRKAAPISQRGRESLRLWVQRKLGKSLAEAKSIAFLIARKKALFPTPGQKYIEKTLDATLPRIVERLETEFPEAVKSVEVQ